MAAKSVIDVILGEAKGGSFEDMLAIASVIENRSRQLGVTPEQVVSVQSEFNAYGKALPPGVGKHRGLAEKALSQVRKDGPTHDATFYATPAASKNLPSGLSKVTSTDGHVFYNDPKNRSIRTAQGFKQPQSSLLSFAEEGPAPPQSAPRTGQEAISASLTQEAPLRSRAARVARDNSGELPPMPALDEAFDFPLGDRPQRVEKGFAYGPENYSMDRMNPEAAYAARRAFDNLDIDPQINSGFRSGARPAGARFSYNTAVGGRPGSQHRHGNALDISVKDMDNQERAALVDALMAEGMGGIGVGPTIIHADTGPTRRWDYNKTPGFQAPQEIKDVIEARTEGGRLNRYPSDFGNIPTPPARPVADFSVGPPTRQGPRGSSAPTPTIYPAGREAPTAGKAPLRPVTRTTLPDLAPKPAPSRPSPHPEAAASPVDFSNRGIPLSRGPSQRLGPRGSTAPTPQGPLQRLGPRGSSTPAPTRAPTLSRGPSQRLGPRGSRAAAPTPVPSGRPSQPPSVNQDIIKAGVPAPKPQPVPSKTPAVGVPMAKPNRAPGKPEDLPMIDANTINGIGIPQAKPEAPKKTKKGSLPGKLLGGVAGGVLLGPIGVVPGAWAGNKIAQKGLPNLKMPNLNLGPVISKEGFSRTPSGRAVNAATRNGGFDNYTFTKTYANSGGSRDPHSYARALADEQRQRSQAGQKTVGSAFRDAISSFFG